MVPSLGNNFTGDNQLGCHREEGTLELQKTSWSQANKCSVVMQTVRLLSTLDLILENGGAERDRTVDLHNAIVALFQLSYGPIPKEGK